MSNLFARRPEYSSKDQMAVSVRHSLGNCLAVQFIDSKTSYNYPEEDFCLFKYFPFNKSIFTQIGYHDQETYLGTMRQPHICAIAFLAQNTKILSGCARSSYQDAPGQFDSSVLEHCNFSMRLDYCMKPWSHLNSDHSIKVYWDYYDTLHIYKWLELIGPVVTFPILTAIAFVLNLLVILVIKSKENEAEQLFKARMFNYILINSVFNCIECLIYELRLIHICIFPNSVFCSVIKSAPVSLFIGTYVTGYLSETVKTCSMLSGLLFSIERYVETSKTKNKVLNFLGDMKSVRVVLFIFGLSLILSCSKLVEQTKVIEKFSFYDSPLKFGVNSLNFRSDDLVTYVYFFHFVLNDCVLLLINFVIDVKLVLVIRRDLKQKLVFQKTSAKSRIKLLKKKRTIVFKTNFMIALNVVIYSFCRFPELLANIFFYFYRTKLESDNNSVGDMPLNCETLILCYLLANSVEYLYMLAYLFNMIIYYKFNKNFRIGFRNFFGLKKLDDDDKPVK